ncbi:hypothetical protein [Dyella sp. C9]|uniref:hypothetical protein n=1 Tax=Dyella sp. C9 TaxID=2202154 RepID=UPI000DEEDBCF|nr:hypothetical protein [Dyella sp. C9]
MSTLRPCQNTDPTQVVVALRHVAATLLKRDRAAIHSLAPIETTSLAGKAVRDLTLSISSLKLFGQPPRT